MDQKTELTVRTLLWEAEGEKAGLGQGSEESEKEGLDLWSMETKTLSGSRAEGPQLLRPCVREEVRERNRMRAWATERDEEDQQGRKPTYFLGSRDQLHTFHGWDT